jgi:hypothetical protein
MLDTLRGRLSHAERVLYFWSRARPENAGTSSPAFFRALERRDEGPYRAPRLLIVNYGYNVTYYTPRGRRK